MRAAGRRGGGAPVVIEGAAWVTGPGSGLDIADLLSWPDYSRICQHYLADRLWESARMQPEDVDFAEIYDCFSAVVLMGLEGLGLARNGSQEILVNLPAQDADTHRCHDEDRDRSAENQLPFLSECKINQDHHRKIFDERKEPKTRTGQERSSLEVRVVSQNTRQ